MLRTSNLTPQEAARHATDPDYLLPGEELGRVEDAAHWMAVYRELLEFKRALLSEAARMVITMVPAAREEARTDQVLLAHQADRYRRRLAHWQSRSAGAAVTGGTPALSTPLLSDRSALAQGRTAAFRKRPTPLP